MKNALFILLFAFTSNAIAATITLDATNSGWYNSQKTSNGGTSLMFAGEQSEINYRNWIAFDLSGITDTIFSATLDIANDAANDSAISFTWSEVTTSFTELSTTLGDVFDNLAVYNDLADGLVFASGTANANTIDNYTLTASAITALNSSSGFWSMGGATLNDLGAAYGGTSGAPGDFIQLTLEFEPLVIPIPAAVWLFGSGLLILAGFARRKKSQI